MKNILNSFKKTFTHGLSILNKEIPELLKFVKQYKLLSFISIVITIIVILLIINLTGINKTITGTVLSKYSVESINTENNSTSLYHVILNKKGIFGMKEKEYLISNEDLYNSIKPEFTYKFRIINNSYITKAKQVNESN